MKRVGKIIFITGLISLVIGMYFVLAVECLNYNPLFLGISMFCLPLVIPLTLVGKDLDDGAAQ